MSDQSTLQIHSNLGSPFPLLGLAGLSVYLDYDDFLYVVRGLYYVVKKAGQSKCSKPGLERRIVRFEKSHDLPGLLSAVPIDLLLNELIDAQYIHPVFKREMTLPTFH